MEEVVSKVLHYYYERVLVASMSSPTSPHLTAESRRTHVGTYVGCQLRRPSVFRLGLSRLASRLCEFEIFEKKSKKERETGGRQLAQRWRNVATFPHHLTLTVFQSSLPSIPRGYPNDTGYTPTLYPSSSSLGLDPLPQNENQSLAGLSNIQRYAATTMRQEVSNSN